MSNFSTRTSLELVACLYLCSPYSILILFMYCLRCVVLLALLPTSPLSIVDRSYESSWCRSSWAIVLMSASPSLPIPFLKYLFFLPFLGTCMCVCMRVCVCVCVCMCGVASKEGAQASQGWCCPSRRSTQRWYRVDPGRVYAEYDQHPVPAPFFLSSLQLMWSKWGLLPSLVL